MKTSKLPLVLEWEEGTCYVQIVYLAHDSSRFQNVRYMYVYTQGKYIVTVTPGSTSVMRKFEQECRPLNAIKHPHIVQYLGMYRDPESRLPVLLMELMDESLTQFLERSHEPIPYHTEVDLYYDIALARFLISIPMASSSRPIKQQYIADCRQQS